MERHRADIHADLADLPLADGSVGRIFAAHVLEHLDYDKLLPQVLAEFRRVLADDGELCVVGPDIERAVVLGEPSQILRSVVRWPPEFNTGNWGGYDASNGARVDRDGMARRVRAIGFRIFVHAVHGSAQTPGWAGVASG